MDKGSAHYMPLSDEELGDAVGGATPESIAVLRRRSQPAEPFGRRSETDALVTRPRLFSWLRGDRE